MTMSSAHSYAIFETAGGFCGIAWNARGVTRFQLPTTRRGLAQIRTPRTPGGCLETAALRHLRAVGIGAGDSTVIGAITLADTGNEERCRALRTATAGLPARAPLSARRGLARRSLWCLGKCHQSSQCGKCCRRQNMSHPTHLDFLLLFRPGSPVAGLGS